MDEGEYLDETNKIIQQRRLEPSESSAKLDFQRAFASLILSKNTVLKINLIKQYS